MSDFGADVVISNSLDIFGTRPNPIAFDSRPNEVVTAKNCTEKQP